MTSKVFTREQLAEMARRATGCFRVAIGGAEFTDLTLALAELDALYCRREAIALQSMREYRRSGRTAAERDVLMAPVRTAEQAQVEAANAILWALGMPGLEF